MYGTIREIVTLSTDIPLDILGKFLFMKHYTCKLI